MNRTRTEVALVATRETCSSDLAGERRKKKKQELDEEKEQETRCVAR